MSKMASHEPFGHLQLKLWAKEGPGVKLPVWLLTTKSWESTSFWRLQKEWDKALEIYRGELQLWLRPHSNQRLEPGVMSVQSLGSPTRNNFGTPPWESRENLPFGCGSRGKLQRILYGEGGYFPESGPWWVKCVKVPMACSQHPRVFPNAN
jgi:hypothetical protein